MPSGRYKIRVLLTSALRALVKEFKGEDFIGKSYGSAFKNHTGAHFRHPDKKLSSFTSLTSALRALVSICFKIKIKGVHITSYKHFT